LVLKPYKNKIYSNPKMKSMDKDKKEIEDQKKEIDENPDNQTEKERIEKKIDEELEQSFPASDPPSYSQPGNDDIKNYE
jgi:hypothetical protein